MFESSALGGSDHSMLRSMVCPASVATDKTSKRRAVDDGAAALLAHLLQFELHAAPDTAQVDRHDPVVIIAGRICSFRQNTLYAGIVIGSIEPSEVGDSLLYHCLHLRVI